MITLFYSANPNNITACDSSFGKRWKTEINYNGEIFIISSFTKPTERQVRLAKKIAINAIKEQPNT